MAERGNLLSVPQRRSNSSCKLRAVVVSRSKIRLILTLRDRGSRSGCSSALVRVCTRHAQSRASLWDDRRAPRKQIAVSTSMSMSTLTQVSGCLASTGVSVCGSHSSRSTLSSAAEARVTTSSHLHNHGLASPDTQAIVVQQELSVALLHSIQEWAQCGLVMTAIRQLVQLELGVPFLSGDNKKKVCRCTLTEL